MQSSPTKHPTAFLVMGGATAGLMFNFLYFKEQFCMIACPYGRFQSVMLDRTSYIVAYDGNRGEPRKKGRRAPAKDSGNAKSNLKVLTLDEMAVQNVGDCVDCGRCTAVCPTGIDIRNGLQLECIHCAQCIDACNQVMQTIGKPTDQRAIVRITLRLWSAGIHPSFKTIGGGITTNHNPIRK